MSNKEYKKYQHVEKLGCDEVDGITIGEVYIFPKIDGINAQAWWDGESMHYGSRTRELSLKKDNAGFMAWASECSDLTELCKKVWPARVFGEWLVPHSLKTYRDEAWRKFYVFDIVILGDEREDDKNLHYDFIAEMCKKHNIEWLAPLRIIKNPSIDDIFRVLPDNNFLIKDGKGSGEGIVLKNYDFRNRFGRQTWAKVVTSEFKEKHYKEMGAPITKGTDMVEERIVEEYCTEALIEKTYEKIRVENDGWNSKMIPQLLGRVFHDLVKEHSWDFCKKYKMPKVDFKNLNRFCIIKIKQTKKELF